MAEDVSSVELGLRLLSSFVVILALLGGAVLVLRRRGGALTGLGRRFASLGAAGGGGGVAAVGPAPRPPGRTPAFGRRGGVALPSGWGRRPRPDRALEVVERQQLSRTSSVAVVRVGSRAYLVSATDSAVSLLADVSGEFADPPAGPAADPERRGHEAAPASAVVGFEAHLEAELAAVGPARRPVEVDLGALDPVPADEARPDPAVDDGPAEEPAVGDADEPADPPRRPPAAAEAPSRAPGSRRAPRSDRRPVAAGAARAERGPRR